MKSDSGGFLAYGGDDDDGPTTHPAADKGGAIVRDNEAREGLPLGEHAAD